MIRYRYSQILLSRAEMPLLVLRSSGGLSLGAYVSGNCIKTPGNITTQFEVTVTNSVVFGSGSWEIGDYVYSTEYGIRPGIITLLDVRSQIRQETEGHNTDESLSLTRFAIMRVSKTAENTVSFEAKRNF